MTKTAPNPTSENQAKDNDEKFLYQALGCVRGELTPHSAKGYGLDIDGKIFPVSFIHYQVGKAPKLLDGKPRFFKVWPQHPTKPDSPLGFRILSGHTEAIRDWPPGVFRLRGVWQFIPQSPAPVLSLSTGQKL
jgi:hypothetical protein